MGKNKSYEMDFKQMIVSLYESGESPQSLASEYGLAQTTVYKWINLYSKESRGSAPQSDLLALQKEIGRLREENNILKKVVTIFAKKEN